MSLVSKNILAHRPETPTSPLTTPSLRTHRRQGLICPRSLSCLHPRVKLPLPNTQCLHLHPCISCPLCLPGQCPLFTPLHKLPPLPPGSVPLFMPLCKVPFPVFTLAWSCSSIPPSAPYLRPCKSCTLCLQVSVPVYTPCESCPTPPVSLFMPLCKLPPLPSRLVSPVYAPVLNCPQVSVPVAQQSVHAPV